MSFNLMVEIAAKSFVASGLALLLLILFKHRSAGERSWIAHAGLAATLFIPIAAALLPKWHVKAPAPALPVETAVNLAAPIGSEFASSPVLPLSAEPQLALSVGAISLWAYAVIAALLLLFTCLAVMRLFILRHRATVLVEPSWLSALAHAQRRMGFKHGTALLVTNELGSPVSWGLLRPIILLNEAAVKSETEAEAIIAHELAHVAHLDWAKLIIARAATALFWFNPLVWLLARQCHQLREEAADDAVLLGDVPSTDYAALLIGAARHDSKPLLLAANGVAPGRGSLKRRVTRVLDTRLRRAPARLAWGSACSLLALLIAAPLSAITTAPAPLPIASAAAPSVKASASAQAVAAAQAAGPAPMAMAASAAATNVGMAPSAATATTAVDAAAVAEPIARTSAEFATRIARQVTAGLTTSIVKDVVHEVVRASPTAQSSPRPVALAQNGRLVSPDTLIAMKIHGVDADYIREIRSIGPRFAQLSNEELVKMRIHRVSARSVQQLAELGYADISFKDLIAAHIHGVSPTFIREMAALGYRGLTMRQLTAMRIHNVTPAYVREFSAAGYDRLSADQLIKLRIHGVDLRPERHPVRDRRSSPPPVPPAPPAPALPGG